MTRGEREAEAEGIWPNGLGCPSCDGTGFVSDEMLDRVAADDRYPYLVELVERLRATRPPEPAPIVDNSSF